jgi:hypothetical protein
MAYKPGSVSRSPKAPTDDHSSGTPVTERLMQPTRMAVRKQTWQREVAHHPYSVLLPVGFTLPALSPGRRCALTAPFHPYPGRNLFRTGRFAFCGTFPEVALAGSYPAPCFRGARTFLCSKLQRPSSHLTVCRHTPEEEACREVGQSRLPCIS